MTIRLPRLSAAKAERILTGRGLQELSELELIEFPNLETEQFAPTGPARVPADYLQSVRSELTVIAKAANYPDRSEVGFRLFDRDASIYLGRLDLPVGQAIRPDTWSWLAVHLVPHLVHWRWGTTGKQGSQARYCGILQRNALGRLWFRAHVMKESGDDPWRTLKLVNEDAHVAILERSRVSRDHQLARAIVRKWHERGGGESALRAAMIRVRMRLLLQDVAGLTGDELDSLAADLFPVKPMPP